MKVLVSVFFCIFITSVHGQININIDPNLIDTTLLDVDISNDNFQIHLKTYIDNEEDEMIELDWKLDVSKMVPEWTYSISENNFDFVPGFLESPIPMMLDSMSQDQIYVLHIYTKSTSGCGTIKIDFYEHDTDIKVDSIIYHVNINDPDCITTEVEEELELISFFPNPTTSLLHFDFKEEIISCEIYDSHGQLLERTMNPNNSLNLNRFENGLYLIKFNAKDKKSFVKSVVKI